MGSRAKSVYVFILISYLIYLIDHYLVSLSSLYLNHANVVWYTVLTSAFCHADFTHLTGNMFFIYFFGLIIEEQVGQKKFILLYILSAILVNIVSLIFMQGNALSVGASGVVFAFFSISIMMKLKWDWKAWVEILVLLPFVLSHIFTELNALGANDNIGHFAHLSGAAIGIVLFRLLKRV